MSSTWTVFACVWVLVCCASVSGHVALTFPPARKYDLDFLDNARTRGPCGMPKGSIRTSFMTGSTFNVNWHLAYAHRGGFSLKILDELERSVLDLTPSVAGSQFIREDATAQSYQVKLPTDFVCENCTLQLLREADEWSSDYRFYSCADIDILAKKDYRETCSGHGHALLGRCKCDRLFSGPRCQHREECLQDGDCGQRGKCINVNATEAPTRMCYCPVGYYGAACNKRSPIKDTRINFNAYTKKDLSDDFKLYWRILKEEGEIEIVMVVNGTSYAGVGWRPKSLTAMCRNFPVLGPPLKPAPKKTPSSERPPISQPLSKPEPSTESKAEPKSEPHIHTSTPTPKPEPEPEPTSESSPVPEPIAEPEPTAEPTATPEPLSDSVEADSNKKFKRVATHSADEIDFKDFGEDVTVKTSISYQVSSKKGRKKRATPDGGYFPLHAYSPKHDFNGMDCTDIVIGTARGKYYRIMDYYTRDRSTPRVDTFWGGKDDLTGAMGFEENGVTTIMFRRKLKAQEPTDHSIVNELMHVIWARGQEPLKYVHSPGSGLEKDKVSVPDFYRPDEIKYHGHGAQRGVLALNFFEESSKYNAGEIQPLEDNKCGGQFKMPPTCDIEANNCTYAARWLYNGLRRGKDTITFTVQTMHVFNKWTGIGFSDDKKMSQTDAIIGWVEQSGRAFMMDTFVSSYGAPRLDESQNIFNMSGRLVDGATTLTFSRKRISNDPKDLSFTDDKCLYVMFPVQGGLYDVVSKKTKKHDQVPIVSTNRVCIKPCGPEIEEVPTTAAPIPGLTAYLMQVRIVGLANNFKPPKQGTAEFTELAQQVKNNFKNELKAKPGYHDVMVDGFKQNGATDIIAQLTLQAIDSNEIPGSSSRSLDSSAAEESSEQERSKWERAVRDTLASGKVGNLNVDPDFFQFEAQGLLSPLPVEDSSSNSRRFFGLSEMKLYMVLGCVAALVFVAFIQAACTIYRGTRSSGGLTKDQLIPNSAWKDYSTANTNYGFEAYDNEDKYNGTASTAPVRDTKPGPMPSNKPGHNGHKSGTRDRDYKMADKGVKMADKGNKMPDTGFNVPGNNGNVNGGGRPPVNSVAQYYHDTRSLQRPRGGGGYGRAPSGPTQERSTYSLPRGTHPNTMSAAPGAYYTQDRRSARPDPATPDFYFMPSQRKYEGEVVRVFVDYGGQ